jgi:hypothetical protein
MIGVPVRSMPAWARVGALLIVALGAVGIGLAVLVWRFGILIPTAGQAHTMTPRAQPEALEEMAAEQSRRAMEAFRDWEEPDAARWALQAELGEIEDAYSGTLAGVRAGQMRVAAMLEGSGCRDCPVSQDEILAEFAQRAVARPSLYFAPLVSYTSSRIVAMAVSHLQGAHDVSGAWRLCRDVRWMSSHPGVMKEACDEVWSGLGFTVGFWQATDTPSARYQYYAFDASLDALDIVFRNLKYRLNPYSGKNVRKLALALYRGGASDLARVLQGEMLALDVANAAQLEGELARLQGKSFQGVRFPDWSVPGK